MIPLGPCILLSTSSTLTITTPPAPAWPAPERTKKSNWPIYSPGLQWRGIYLGSDNFDSNSLNNRE